MLEGKNLSRSNGGRKIIDNVDVQIEQGEITVIIGPSGSGKTTLLKLLALLDKPDCGSISIDGKEFKYGQTNPSPWPEVTCVFQQLFLWPHLTLLENIKLPQRSKPKIERRSERQGTIIDAEIAAEEQAEEEAAPKAQPEREYRRLEDLIEIFEMKEFINRYPNEASLGQRQRTALVRALVLQPKYLLLDEITSSLDVEQIAVILTYLKRLSHKGIGVMIITHLLNFAREAADKIIFVDSGQIIECGGREVLDNPQQERVKKFLSVIESAS